MKKEFKVFLSMVLVSALLIPNISAFAATKKSTKLALGQQEGANNITILENDLKTNGTDVISELNKQIANYQIILKNSDGEEERNKVERLITTTEELIRDYSNYKQYQSNNDIPESDPVLGAEVAAVIAYFDVNGYNLAAELLTHARDHHEPDGLYEPYYGYLCAQSPVVDAIWQNPNATVGSAAFTKNAFSPTVTTDLFYAIHSFRYIKHIEVGNSFLEIEDTYDYASGDYPTSIGGIAVEAMYQAQEAGILTPYEVFIELTR